MIVDIDCRGLEFVDFKADVRFFLSMTYCLFCVNWYIRANGKPKELTPLHRSRRLTSQRVNGMTMMRRPEMRFRSRRLGGRLKGVKECINVLELSTKLWIELWRIESWLVSWFLHFHDMSVWWLYVTLVRRVCISVTRVHTLSSIARPAPNIAIKSYLDLHRGVEQERNGI